MDKARAYADMQGSGFIKDPELIIYINNGLRRYYDLINSTGQDYNLKSSQFQGVYNQQNYTLPTDFLYDRGVDVLMGGTPTGLASDQWISIDRFTHMERNQYRGYMMYPQFTKTFIKYNIIGNQISFLPNVISGTWFQIWYNPVMPDLVATTDTVDGINGYDDYIARLAAADMKAKQEDDTSRLDALIMKYESDIKTYADNRNRDRGDRISDVNATGRGFFW